MSTTLLVTLITFFGTRRQAVNQSVLRHVLQAINAVVKVRQPVNVGGQTDNSHIHLPLTSISHAIIRSVAVEECRADPQYDILLMHVCVHHR